MVVVQVILFFKEHRLLDNVLFRIITIEMITMTVTMMQGMAMVLMAMTMTTAEMMLMPMMRTRTRMPRAWRGGGTERPCEPGAGPVDKGPRGGAT